MGTTSDPSDPRLTRGVDEEPTEMAETYLVLPEEKIKEGFMRPVRTTYVHDVCGHATTMGTAIAETYASNPSFYGATWCANCAMHRPVGPNGEFTWWGTDEKVGA